MPACSVCEFREPAVNTRVAGCQWELRLIHGHEKQLKTSTLIGAEATAVKTRTRGAREGERERKEGERNAGVVPANNVGGTAPFDGGASQRRPAARLDARMPTPMRRLYILHTDPKSCSSSCIGGEAGRANAGRRRPMRRLGRDSDGRLFAAAFRPRLGAGAVPSLPV